MSVKVKINIFGLAACFYNAENQFWNIVFVCDRVHPLKFTYPKSGAPVVEYLRESEKDLEIGFRSDHIVPVGDPYGAHHDRLFNMAAEYAHGPGNLRLLRRRKAADLVWMRVPSSVLSATQFTANDYFVQEQTYPGAPVEIIDPVAKEGILSLEIDADLTMTVTHPLDPGYKKEFRFEAVDGDFVLEFDNDCHANCTHNDFLDLYEFLIDGNDEDERQFAAGQVKVSYPIASQSKSEKKKKLDLCLQIKAIAILS